MNDKLKEMKAKLLKTAERAKQRLRGADQARLVGSSIGSSNEVDKMALTTIAALASTVDDIPEEHRAYFEGLAVGLLEGMVARAMYAKAVEKAKAGKTVTEEEPDAP